MRGFTLIELMVVSAIIVAVSTIVLLQGRGSERAQALNRSAERVAFELERAKSLALQTKSFGSVVPCGYGLFFSSNPTSNQSYYLYANTPQGATCASVDLRRKGPSEDVAEIILEKNIIISGFGSIGGNELHIVFTPPRPQLKAYPRLVAGRAEIVLGVSGGNLQKKVIVGETGEIRIE